VWKVGKYTRTTAHLNSRAQADKPETVKFGGTNSDEQVLSYFKSAKAKGLKTTFYPSLLVDSNEQSDCWRGFITGDGDQLERFMQEQYKPFILHYATLLKDVVDVFLVGSQMEGLASLANGYGKRLFASKLVKLSEEVRSILGDKVLQSYAAHLSEYQSVCGGDRRFDEYWADKNTDFVGIDAFFPLANSNDSNMLKKAWTSGEGFDYYLGEYQEKKTFSDASAKWKDLNTWWSKEHWSWDGKTCTSEKTPWAPEMKKIKFTSWGVRSTDANLYPHMHDDQFPECSRKTENVSHQVAAIKATIDFVKENKSLLDGFSCYYYDSRGRGWSDVKKDEKYLYSDRHKFPLSHNIDGKIGKTVKYSS
jgi:hypothetical protein